MNRVVKKVGGVIIMEVVLEIRIVVMHEEVVPSLLRMPRLMIKLIIIPFYKRLRMILLMLCI